MDPIRVLQVFANLDRGGAETMIMNVYRNIDRSRVQFDFVANAQEKECAFEPEIIELGGRIFRVPQYIIINHRSYKRAWEILLQQHREIRIIHGHHTSPAFVYLKVGKSLNRLTIAHSHIAGGDKTLKSKIKILMRYPLRHRADFLFACSHSAAKWMFGEKHLSTYIVNNAIETRKFVYNECIRLEKLSEMGFDNKFIIGHIGRFDSQKNHEFLIDIFKAVNEINDEAFLLLVGDGELRSSIKKKVDSLKLSEKVLFAGIRSDVPELLQAIDVFLFPSHYEGLGIVAVEAQAAGLPTIVSENVPEEAYVTDLIEKESLKTPADRWADRVLEYSNGYKRIDTSEQIKAKGYDIAESTKWWEKFYLKEHEKLSTKHY